ncbi:hypothetical protein A3Q56_01476 [Intoshia linei]|uniref:Uncharacterized protein n=1 Tax=Intoshia linei TaxID=1819745 RepID=A0A177B969_9BILA|nr:hypothetical protein A3Q56_01476 [Intoshia linei]
MTTNCKYRVKLYTMNKDGCWDDSGTGFISVIATMDDTTELVMKSEKDDDIIIKVRIDPSKQYEKQRQSLIVWTSDDLTEYALSFQSSDGCDEILDIINLVIKKENGDATNDTVDDDLEAPASLPEVKIENITEILYTLNGNSIFRDRYINLITPKYFTDLVDLFKKLDDLEDTDNLKKIYDIFSSIIFFNRTEFFDLIFEDGIFIHVIGALEYNPDFNEKRNYRDFLTKKVKFKKCIDFTNKKLFENIHKAYNMKFLYDIVAPVTNLFEEHALSNLTSKIASIKVDIVNLVLQEKLIFRRLTNILIGKEDNDTSRSEFPDDNVYNTSDASDLENYNLENASETEECVTPNTPDSCPIPSIVPTLSSDPIETCVKPKSEDELLTKRNNCLLFVRELTNFAVNLNIDKRNEFYDKFIKCGFFQVLEYNLKDEKMNLDCVIVEILSQCAEYNCSLIRNYILNQDKNDVETNFMELLLDKMFSDQESGMSNGINILHIFKNLLDPDSMNGYIKMDRSDFVKVFFKKGKQGFNKPLTELKENFIDNYFNAQVISIIAELLLYCVDFHPFQAKVFIMDYDIIGKLTVIFQSKFKFTKLAVIRLVRKIITKKDNSFNKYLVDKGMLKCVFECFLENEHQNNLIDSAIIDFFEYMITEKIFFLLTYIIDNHFTDSVSSLTYVSTFKRMDDCVKRYRNNEPPLASNSLSTSNVSKKSYKLIDDEEELWFDQEESLEVDSKLNDDDDDDFLFSKSKNVNIDDFEDDFKPRCQFKTEEEDSLMSVKNRKITFNLGNSPHPFPKKKSCIGSLKLKILPKLSNLVDYSDEESDDEDKPADSEKKKKEIDSLLTSTLSKTCQIDEKNNLDILQSLTDNINIATATDSISQNINTPLNADADTLTNCNINNETPLETNKIPPAKRPRVDFT